MAVRKTEMKRRLMEQRDRLLAEVQALQNKVAGLEMAIALIDGDNAPAEPEPARGRRGGSKATILDLLTETGTTGLNAATACEVAARRGIALDRGTVSSLLSRLKRDGVAVYDGNKYRLASFAPQRQSAETADGPSSGLKVVVGGAG